MTKPSEYNHKRHIDDSDVGKAIDPMVLYKMHEMRRAILPGRETHKTDKHLDSLRDPRSVYYSAVWSTVLSQTGEIAISILSLS